MTISRIPGAWVEPAFYQPSGRLIGHTEAVFQNGPNKGGTTGDLLSRFAVRPSAIVGFYTVERDDAPEICLLLEGGHVLHVPIQTWAEMDDVGEGFSDMVEALDALVTEKPSTFTMNGATA